MKISKVNHVRTATKVNNNQGEGIIYVNPSKQGNAEKDLEKHIESLNRKAQGLYSPLNQYKSSKKIKRGEFDIDREAHKRFSNLIKEIIKENKESIQDPSELDRIIKSKAKSINLHTDHPEKIAEGIIEKYLRKSLKAYSAIARDVLVVIISSDKEEKINSLDKKMLCDFFAKVYEDYYKKEQIKLIKKSIEDKDVKVQVRKDSNNEAELALSSADNKKKHFYFDFMKEFSSKDKKEREEMLIRFRQLIILFYSGYEKYKLSIGSDIGPWTFGSSLPEVSENFDEEMTILVNEYTEEQNNEDKIKKEIKSLKEALSNCQYNSHEYKNIDEKIYDKKTELSDCKIREKNLKSNIDNRIERILCDKYRDSIKTEGLSDSDIFWIGYIQGVAEKLFDKKGGYSNFRMSSKYLYEVTFNEWISFMALKFVDMGKAVYHFAMPDCRNIRDGREICAGKVNPMFENGITSFDYERIKAKETITRAFAVSSMYAAGLFSNAVTKANYRMNDNSEDPMYYKDEDWKEALNPKAKKHLLMYFGGQFKWKGTEIDEIDALEMTLAFRNSIKNIRNYNFHYDGKLINQKEKYVEVEKTLFKNEFSNIGRIIREKYLSNNVPVFYGISDINKMMDYLYSEDCNKEAQIPSFGNVYKKKDIPSFVAKNVPGNMLAKYNTENLEKYRSCLYFVLKEIYYYGFLKEKDVKERFIKALNNSSKDENNKEALDNFKARIKELGESCSFGDICQTLMTDYNQQNQGEYKIKSQVAQTSDEKNNKGHKYSHFKMLLYVTLQKAYIEYLHEKEDVFAYLGKPLYKENFFDTDEAKEFVSSWNAGLFNNLKNDVLNDSHLLSWYILGHLLPAKQLNNLQGDIKSYIQFAKDINKREENVIGFVKDRSLTDGIGFYEKLLKVMEFTMLFVGKTSNILTDYFDDEDDYAMHLYSYVNYVSKKEEKNNASLAAFCQKPISKKNIVLADKIGIYHDGTNPIINSNIIKAKMFGNERILSGAIEKVNGDTINGEIVKYYALKSDLSKVFEKGECVNIFEQGKLREFQNLKNRIELQDISIFTDILNDYMSELVNMAYLRERDLMYYQLGFNYLRNKNSIVEEKYETVQGDGINIKSGLILYQIMSLYSFNLSTIYVEDGKYKLAMDRKIVRFIKDYCNEDMKDSDNVYLKGLELFENINRHGEYINLRNEIDHQKYFATSQKSILDMYSEIYNGFFNYDLKLKKSVSYIISNILAKYFVIAETQMKTVVEDNGRMAKLSIKELKSDEFNYKAKKNDKLGKEKEISYSLPVRSEGFLKEVKKLLNYKTE